jgi:hypothetical protein
MHDVCFPFSSAGMIQVRFKGYDLRLGRATPNDGESRNCFVFGCKHLCLVRARVGGQSREKEAPSLRAIGLGLSAAPGESYGPAWGGRV